MVFTFSNLLNVKANRDQNETVATGQQQSSSKKEVRYPGRLIGPGCNHTFLASLLKGQRTTTTTPLTQRFTTKKTTKHPSTKASSLFKTTTKLPSTGAALTTRKHKSTTTKPPLNKPIFTTPKHKLTSTKSPLTKAPSTTHNPRLITTKPTSTKAPSTTRKHKFTTKSPVNKITSAKPKLTSTTSKPQKPTKKLQKHNRFDEESSYSSHH